MVAQWPEFPNVYSLLDCPEGAVCISQGDHLAIVFWVDQVERIHTDLASCPGVQFTALPVGTLPPTVSPAPTQVEYAP